ncbi:hypothetical protein EVG20_g1283 [Dentipellis fragilis]|uniref:Uncharacterized protein n=1 Tax=Dentipellis fragilis TaxID=205917 RepID=A0A4Y9ZB81_9AGAM|nr:hypothetical protein EVG20_g1283 [Dentipellis fragilis]
MSIVEAGIFTSHRIFRAVDSAHIRDAFLETACSLITYQRQTVTLLPPSLQVVSSPTSDRSCKLPRLPPGAVLSESTSMILELTSMLTSSDFWRTVTQERFKTVESPSSSARAPSQNAVETLDEDIAAIDRMRFEFVRRRNANLPIYRLPADVLAHIFWLILPRGAFTARRMRTVSACDSPHWSQLELQRFPDLDSAIEVTHVCSQWRAVALAHANLWTLIDLSSTSKEWARAAIARSMGHAISIELSQAKIKLSELLKSQKDWSRVRSLGIECPTSDLVELFKPGGPSLLPSLKYLSIDNLDDPAHRRELFSPSCNITLPDLSALILCNCTIAWDNFPQFSHLKHLELLNFSDHPPRHSLEHVYNALRALPHLRDLALFSIFPEAGNTASLDPNSPILDGVPIPFPHMEHLRLKGRGDDYALLFGAMELPPTVSAILEVWPATPFALDMLFVKCAVLMTHPLRLRVDAQDGVTEIRFWRTRKTVWDDDEMYPHIHLTIHSMVRGRDDMVLRKIGEPPPPLRARAGHPIMGVLALCESATELKIVDRSAVEYGVIALGTPAQMQGAGPRGWRYFPMLRKLELQCMDGHDNAGLWDTVIFVLKIRHEAGVRLKEIHITTWPGGVSEKQKALLHKYADKVGLHPPKGTAGRQ